MMKCYSMTISDLRDAFNNHQINLEPPYQRKPAWKHKQRQLLLSSIFNGIPIPAVIFHKNFDTKRKKDIFDVLDGKQRIETILHFLQLITISDEDELSVIFSNPITCKKDSLIYRDLQSKKFNKEYENIMERFWRYELPIIEYTELIDFFNRPVASKEVFVRINSTGSPLKRHEIRHARDAGPFFDLGDELEKYYKKFFLSNARIVSKSDIDRYQLHEFILELCTAIHLNGFSDRRRRLEELLTQHKWKNKDVRFIKSTFRTIIQWINSIFPNYSIKTTRFRNKSDFYSLFIVLLTLYNKGYVTTDKKSNRTAGKFLLDFSLQIQQIDPKIKAYSRDKLKANEQKLLQYIISTRQATDSVQHRETRHNYLMSVLQDGFILHKRDSKRIFSRDVKDLLWTQLAQKTKKPKCPNPVKYAKCKKYLSYEDAEVDHKFPWSKGGRTILDNARLICSSCNRSKGNR